MIIGIDHGYYAIKTKQENTHLRREQRSHNKTKSKFSEDLIIDYSDRSLYIKGHKIELSNKEFEIIQLLSSNAGQVFDREKIYENIWGIDGNGDSVVIKEHIRKIRLKFNEFTDKGYITTVWGSRHVRFYGKFTAYGN